MKVLVAYASKYGATKGIAERVAGVLHDRGLEVDLRPCDEVHEASGYDAYVIGSAAYMFRWRKDATKLVRRNAEVLARHPVWLFSSGPLGTDTVDKDGNDVLEGARPKQFDEYEEELHPRGTMVFFGALDPDKLHGPDRIVHWMPENDALPAGDFRDWEAIDAWADGIAAELAKIPAA